jgi:hypothetical protein
MIGMLMLRANEGASLASAICRLQRYLFLIEIIENISKMAYFHILFYNKKTNVKNKKII